MDVILNIGLAREGNSNIGSGTVIREVIKAFGAASFEFMRSDTELTCVACVSSPNTLHLRNNVNFLALLLGQDCIAAYDRDSKAGWLIGPRADKWGAFNPQYFFLLDGTRLAAPAAQAA